MPTHPTPSRPPLLTVMGVSGSGKTTIGAALAQRLRVPFVDADDLHSPENVAKMSAGLPLDDADRLPWLRVVGAWQAAHVATGGVVSCSALKRSYRDVMRAAAPSQFFVHMHGSKETIVDNVTRRTGHFMPAALVESQLRTLEPLEPDEPGTVIPLGRDVDATVECLIRATGLGDQ